MNTTRHKEGIIVDIDDTLADTSLALAGRLWGVAPLSSFVSHVEALKEWGMPDLVPEWRESTLFQDELAPLLDSEEFLLSLPKVEAAYQGVLELQKKTYVACYLTSRLTKMHAVTEEWLKLHHFPQAPVICRPPEIMARDWKLQYIPQHFPDTLAYIDNELVMPKELSYRGRLVEIIRFKKLTPQDPRQEVYTDWESLLKSF